MVAGEIVRCVCRYAAPNTSDVLCVHFFEYSGAGDLDSTVLSVLDIFFTTGWGPDWQASASQDFDFEEIEVDVINTDGTVARNIGSAAITLNGSVVGDMEPSGCAMLLSAETALPKQRGRKYVPGLTDSDVVDGLITAARITTLGNLLSEYLQTISVGLVGALEPGVLSTALSVFVAFASAGAITDVPAYQRRRKPDVGS